MAGYTFQQLEQIWTSNGGSAEWAPTMAAVAMAESGGDPSAHNPSGASGLWQILMSAQGAAFQKQWGGQDLNDPNVNAKIAIQMLGGGPGISNWTADPVGTYVVSNGSKPLSAAQAQQLAGNPSSASGSATLLSDTVAAPAANSNDTAMVPSTTFAAPEQGANVKNFHGYDLTAVPRNELGNAEQAIQKYITDPGYATQLQQRISQDYGYQGSWAEKIPQLNSVLIWAATNLDLSTAAGKNQFQSAVYNTTWWKTTDANQRSWQQVQGTDPAQAAQALGDAQEKVLADANQMGVQLTKQELDSIANVYAAQTFTQSGSLGSQSGTVAEWLDQAITDTVLNIKNQKAAGMTTDFSTLPAGQSTFATDTANGNNPQALYGISAQLYNDFQGIAQQYLMFNPNNPKGGLLTQQDLLGYVQDALKNYTGTGSSFGSSNLIAGAQQQFTQTMMEKAAQAYPSLASAIQGGITPQTYTASQSNLITSTLGLPQGSINFTDPQWNWAIATPNAQTGQKQALTNDQILQKITSPNFKFTGPNGQSMSYNNTNNAMQQTQSLIQNLSGLFGTGGT